MDTPSTLPLEELLSHAHWARALARQLLRDEERADDVVQEAWLAAVERPPRPGPGLRVWFARLIRNLANNLRRAEQRRARHERGAAAPALAPPASAPIVDELAAQQLVAQALLALDEPYRETLIRRWYRDEKPAAIARAMQVPVKTVDTRLARGIEKLRAELTARRGGASRDWCLMLAPLAQAGTATGVVAAWTGGALTMTGLAKFTAAVVVAAAAIATWIAIERSNGENAVHRVAAADANGSNPTPAVASPQDAAVAPDRKSEPTAAASPAPSPKDNLAGWRGEWSLRGRIVEKVSRAPMAGVAVTAQVAALLFGDLETVKTDANGEFTLDGLGTAIRMKARAPGCLSFDVPIGKDELAAAGSAPPRVFEMEKLTFGALVCTLRSRDGRPLPARIRAGANVVYTMASIGAGYEHERFDRMPLPIANGPSAEMVIPAVREGDVFRIEHAPARTPIQLLARLDHSQVGRLRVEPLAPDETRAVEISIDAGIVVDVDCRDAATDEHVSMEWAKSYTLRLAWNGPRAVQHSERSLRPNELEGALLLPIPGRIRITGALDGFAPIDWSGDVIDGSRIAIALTRWRPLFVKVVTADGSPWRQRTHGPLGESPTTHRSGMGFMESGRAPDCVLVPDGAPLPAELDFDAPRVAKLGGKIGGGGGSFILRGFEGFAPSIPLRVGIYDDGRLIGSAEVPAIAPLADPPPAPSGVASVPDAPPKPWADRYGPTQAVTVTVDPPPPSDGTLRFRAITSEDGKPAAHYEVELEPLVFGEFDAGWGSSSFKVDDAKDGLFAATAIPAGDWRMRIRRGPVGIDGWIGVVSIDALRETDLGTLTLQCPGTLDVHVVDEAGTPAADAEIHITNGKSATRLEFSVVQGQVHQMSARSDARGEVRLELVSGKVRVEVTSAGYAPAFADVEVPPNGKATCTITLKSLDPAEPPAEPSKR